MAIHSTEISSNARYADLPDLMTEFARQAGLLGLADADCRRLQLVLEELFTNSITHGHGSEGDARIAVVLIRSGHGITLRYTDHALPFDLTRHPGEPESENTIGGLGIALIRGLSQAIRYQRREHCNIVELDFQDTLPR